MSGLAHLRGRVAALSGAIVFLLAAGVWIALTHASAQQAGNNGHSASKSPAASPTVAALTVVSVTPATHSKDVDGANPITIHFSAALAADSPLPKLKPRVAGRWRGRGTSTLKFVPANGFAELKHVSVKVTGGARGVKSAAGGLLAHSVRDGFETGSYQPARLTELLSQLGYLPLQWAPASGAAGPAVGDAAGQLRAAFTAPKGQYSWKPGYPSELRAFWDGGSPSGKIVTGAVMAFESDHDLTMDGIAGPQVWTALLKAVGADQANTHGYTYALAREANPETLTIWHNGRVVEHTLANTGISAAPTTLGTAPVYLRYRFQVMKGTNPDGTKYADPVQFVSYFRAGEAVHYFPRGSYGFPQSLGCVELPIGPARQAWPYLTYGSLVTVARGSQTPSTSPNAG